MLHHVDGESELWLDDALDPILISTWIGPATLELVEKLQHWNRQQVAIAKRERRPLIMVSDGTRAGRPSAAVRRAFSELERVPELEFRSYVVVSNPLVRGAMTAIGWLMGDAFDVISCSTMAEALEQAAAFANANDLVAPSSAKIAAYLARANAPTG